MARVCGAIVIATPPEVVFDHVADQRNEPTYNPQMARAEKLTDGPIGVGTRFAAVITSRGRQSEMVIEITEYQRPIRLGSRTTMSEAIVDGTLTFEAVSVGTRMSWCWTVTPTGFARVLAPLVGVLGRRQEQRIWTGLKHHLEAAQEPR